MRCITKNRDATAVACFIRQSTERMVKFAKKHNDKSHGQRMQSAFSTVNIKLRGINILFSFVFALLFNKWLTGCDMTFDEIKLSRLQLT